MKTKIFLMTFLVACLYLACEDDMDNLGMGMMPPQDEISLYDAIMDIDGTTIKLDSIYAHSSRAYLGNFYDPDYGDIKAGYACQFLPGFFFGDTDSIINHHVDSITLDIYYFDYLGDSITPMEVSVYEINKSLEKNYYTNVDPAEFCNMTKPLARRSYTARDLTISDAVNDSLNTAGEPKHIAVHLPREIGQRFLDKYIEMGETEFEKNFIDLFPGLYMESSFGMGNIINVEVTSMTVYFEREYAVVDTLGNIEIEQLTDFAVFKMTPEVIQLNSFKSAHESHLLEPSEDKMYMKTPAGVYPKITIPLAQIRKEIGNRKFNNVSLSVTAEAQADRDYVLRFPGVAGESYISTPKILLIEPDSVTSFFEGKNKQSVADNKTTFTATYNSVTKTYDFSNISNVVQNAIDKIEDQEKDLELLMIPVLVQSYYYQSSSYSSGSYIDYVTYHYLHPSGVTLKKGNSNLQITIIASDLEINQ